MQRVAELSEQYGESRTMQLLREEGHPAQTAAGWTKRSVANILHNERYTGHAVFQRITVEIRP